METDTESCFKVPKFHDETILSTPLPQATSTVDKRPDLLPEKELGKRPSEDSGRGSGYLSDGILSINKLQEELRAVLENQKVPTNDSKKTSLSSNNCAPESISLKKVDVLPSDLNGPQTKSDEVIRDSVSNMQNSGKRDSLPVLRNAMRLSTIPELSRDDIRNASLPCLTSSKIVTVDPEFNRRATFSLCDDDVDLERKNVREKALKALAYEDLHLEIPRPEQADSKSSSFSFDDLRNLSLPMNSSKNEGVSGFSDLIHESDLHREEEICAQNFMPLKPSEASFSDSKNCSMMTQYFDIGSSDSFWEFLGPSHQESMSESNISKDKENCSLNSVDLLSSVPTVSKRDFSRRETSLKEVNTSHTHNASVKHAKENKINSSLSSNTSKTSRLTSNAEILHNMNDLKNALSNSLSNNKSFKGDVNSAYPPTSLMDDSLSHEIPRMSEIAQVLKDTDIGATPISLVKKVLASQQQKSASRDESMNYSRNVSDCSSISLNTTTNEKYYELNVVYGGGIELLLFPQFGLEDTIWTAEVDSNKVICKIKQNPPSSIAVPMFPKVNENIELKILEVTVDKCFHTFHNISLKVEPPKVQFEKVEVFDFELVPECSISKIPFKITCLNKNMVVICVRIKDVQDQMLTVEFDDLGTSQMMDLFPEKPLTGKVILNPKFGFCKDVRKMVHWESAIQICLVHLLNSEVICEVKVKADIFKTSFQVSLLNNVFMAGEEKYVALRNQSPCDVEIECTTNGHFTVSPSVIRIPTNTIACVRVEYVPPKPINSDGELILKSNPGNLSHVKKLIGKSDDSNQRNPPINATISDIIPSFAAQPLCTSSANTSMSTSGSSYEVDGPLQLLCSQVCLVWPSRTVGCDSPSVKSALFTKRTDSKEKLLFEIIDPTSSFQFVCDGKRKSSLITTVSNSSRREISVDFTPRRAGQIKGEISIKRVHSDTYRKTIELFGFGGNGRLLVENVDFDFEEKSFQVSLSHVDQKGQFILQNVGDGVAFFNTSLMNAAGIIVDVSPTRGLLNPGEKMTVTISLNLDHIGSGFSPIQDILRKNKKSEILLLNLAVVCGDQPTRLRICRIYKKYKNEPELLQAPLVCSAMAALCNIFPTDRSDKQSVNLLKDPLKSVWGLFEKGINEWSIGVVIPRSALEEIVLDTSQQFVSLLENPTLEETECSTFFESNSLMQSSQRF